MDPDRTAMAAGDAADRSQVARRVVLYGLIVFAVLQPAVSLLGHPLDGHRWFLVIGSVVITGLFCWRLNGRKFDRNAVPWLSLAAILALGIALFAVGGANWLATLAITAAVFGRYSRTPTPAVVGATACGVAGVTVAVVNDYQSALIVAAALIAPMGGLFAYSASRRAGTLEMLKRTRAELARAAVAEERLRIARDVHDLLGHSLSLITLKAELARRIIGADPDRAAREIAELETVARQSLADVREAVAGYRQPDLAGELTAARQLLDAAGVTSVINSTDAASLPQAVDGVLAWTVREGATNVVRHSRATRAAITVRADHGLASAEIRDNGPGGPDDLETVPAASLTLAARPAPVVAASALAPARIKAAARPVFPPAVLPSTTPARSGALDGHVEPSRAQPTVGGSGLAGLAERVRALGGELTAGAVDPRGFRLRVVVPVGPPLTESSSEAAPPDGTIGG